MCVCVCACVLSDEIKEHYGLLSPEPFAAPHSIRMQDGFHRKATRGSCDIQQRGGGGGVPSYINLTL